jgi:hypothetical protein
VSDIAIIVGCVVVVAFLRFRYAYRWSRGRELHFEYAQQHIPSRNPALLNMASGVLSIVVGFRLYVAMQDAFIGIVATVLAFLAAFVSFVFFGFVGQLGVLTWHMSSAEASDEDKSRLLGFSSVEEMQRINAAALGFSSVEEMHAQQETAYARIQESVDRATELHDQVRRMAASGVPVDKAVELFGAKHDRAIRHWYKEAEESSAV